jgi:hypothetical protein
MSNKQKGSLVLVGTGHRFAGQVTLETLACLQKADKVFYICDALTAEWLAKLNPTAESLDDCYAEGKNRQRTYNEMADRMLASVRAGLNVCTAFYGHPGVIVTSGHKAIRRARREGYPARMLPGISAEDCLIADLGFDPQDGCQNYEATDFLVRRRRFDTTVALVLWQIAAIGIETYCENPGNWNPQGLKLLTDTLLKSYPASHRVIVYEAVQYPTCAPNIQRISLGRLPQARIKPESTLFVPPSGKPRLDSRMLRQLYDCS